MSAKFSMQNAQNEVTILNRDELIYAMGGTQDVSCPMLTSCGTFSNCNDKCTVKGIDVGL